jgi:hypothetical protein
LPLPTRSRCLRPSARRAHFARTLKQLLMAMFMVAGLIFAVWAYVSVESFIVSDERFLLTRVPGARPEAGRVPH